MNVKYAANKRHRHRDFGSWEGRLMTAKTTIIGIFTALALMGTTADVSAESALEKTLANGAKRLTADEIADQFVGKTGTWVSPSGDKKIAIYYGENNDLHAEKLGGGWTGEGYYAIANTDDICISWNGSDKGRLRCLDVLVVGGVVTKFNVDGSLNGTYDSFVGGKTF